MNSDAQRFYDHQYRDARYARLVGERHPFYVTLVEFIRSNQIQGKRCLEIGCGRGAFQDVVENYTGVDISYELKKYFHKPFIQCDATALPFRDETFDVIWSYAALEHVPNVERALQEMLRVIRDSGLLLLKPAWMCAPWVANGYPVRNYKDLDIAGKLIKATIPLRKSMVFRSTYLIPKRVWRTIQLCLRSRPLDFRYKKLQPNYEKLWMSDSDAVNCMDPHEAILYFESRGHICVSHPHQLRRLFIRGTGLVIQVRK